jgi:hypothetical protein
LEEKELEIFSENHQQDSIEVLSYLGFLFDDIGFKVETTRKTNHKNRASYNLRMKWIT